ncbi:MAG: hypothetical protein QMC80_07615 [Thermoplasmatales archaeon]|nr:hypothetical protein [Thermoplasmatales archaeon]
MEKLEKWYVKIENTFCCWKTEFSGNRCTHEKIYEINFRVDATEIAKQFPSILGKVKRLFRKMESYTFHTIKNTQNGLGGYSQNVSLNTAQSKSRMRKTHQKNKEKREGKSEFFLPYLQTLSYYS